ncbi:MAG: hypothetical protein PVG30_03845 [Gammaproteobacteria bacterium]|jgi:hypothetical protein
MSFFRKCTKDLWKNRGSCFGYVLGGCMMIAGVTLTIVGANARDDTVSKICLVSGIGLDIAGPFIECVSVFFHIAHNHCENDNSSNNERRPIITINP